MIKYIIAIDRDDDGNFNDAGEDISAGVLELRWRLGMEAAYDSMAAQSWARITLHNPRGEFSPERHSLQIGERVRIFSELAGERRRHFSGVVRQVEPDAGTLGDKQAVIQLQDIQPWLEDSLVQLPPQVDVSADEVIAQLLDQAIVRPAILAGFCLIDVPGYNQIDGVRVFPEHGVARRLAPGKSRFAYVGDWWGDSLPIRQAIAEVAASERGRFYLDREGVAVFLNRHYTLTHKTIAAHFRDDMSGMEYSYGDQRVNRVSLQIRPREIGESGSLLWQLRQPLRIERHSELLLNLRLVDEHDQPLALLEYDGLVTRFQEFSAGTSPLPTEDLLVEVLQLGASSVQLRLSNRSGRDLQLTVLQLLGKPLYRRDPLEIVVADGAGIYLYGLKQLSLDLPALSDIATARAFATYEIARRKHPQGLIRQLQINARQHQGEALALTLFDRIRISETQTGHQARDYFIIGEEHHVSAGGTRHEVRWTLEAADSTRFVILDDSQIDDGAEVLAPF